MYVMINFDYPVLNNFKQILKKSGPLSDCWFSTLNYIRVLDTEWSIIFI